MKKKKNKKSLSISAVLLAMVATIIMVTALTMAGNLEPTAPPGPTMKTLNEIPPTWSQTFPTASDRFELVLHDEAVLDKETGLVWARNANLVGIMPLENWYEAIEYCYNLEIGSRKGWRLPTIEELSSLVDPHSTDPALPPGFASFFDNVSYGRRYWSSTTHVSFNDAAWCVNMESGYALAFNINSDGYVWPVRGGSGPILTPHSPP